MRAIHLTLASTVGFLFVLAQACASKTPFEDVGHDASVVDAGNDSAQTDGPELLGDAEGEAGCRNLECKKVKCDHGTTTVSGTVFAPNGTLPLYNVIVYIPNDPLKEIPDGVQCDRCGAIASGNPVNVALTDAQGHFVLEDVPVGGDIPLVVQLGKWRRETTISVEPCTENVLTDPELTRLPRNRTEGSMPRIAITSGGCDQLACMLPKVGIDASEFGIPGEDKAVIFYKGSGGSGPSGLPEARALWDHLEELMKYDMAVFSCECSEYDGSTKDAISYQAVYDYLAAGGRIFTTDFQYLWYKKSPNPELKDFASIRGGAPSGGSPILLDTEFPKGKALADWMAFVDPSVTYGQVKPDYVFANFISINTELGTTWGSSGGEPRFLTVNVPVGVDPEQQCGKAVHLDAHINQNDQVNASFPAGCTSPIKQGEEAFAFFFFDLASCIQKEDVDPIIPH